MLHLNASRVLKFVFLALLLLLDTQAFPLSSSSSSPNQAQNTFTKHGTNEEQNEYKNNAFIHNPTPAPAPATASTFAPTPTKPHPQYDQFRMRSLLPRDAEYVNSRWPYKSSKSLFKIRRQIIEASSKSLHSGTPSPNCCLGIEHCHTSPSSSSSATTQNRNDQNGDSNDDLVHLNTVLVACILQYPNGALGMLHVDESFRRYGLGGWLLKEATARLERHGSPCFAFIVDNNKASEALFTKHGWVKENPNEKRGTGRRRAKRKWIKNKVKRKE